MRVTDVLCLSAVTVRSLVHEWFDAEGLDIRPGEADSCRNKKSTKRVKELYSLEQQHANMHQLFIKL